MSQLRILLFGLFLFLIVPFYPVQAQNYNLVHNGIERSYILEKFHADKTPEGSLLPVIIVMHGGGGNGEMAKEMTGFSEKARSENQPVMIVYPTGTGRFKRIKKLKTWNADHCCSYAMENNIDDTGFISTLIDKLVNEHNADPRRIYVTGMSNGAMMTNRLGIRLADKIAAIAPVMGGMFGDEGRASSSVSALIINGGQDAAVPLQGGYSEGRGASTWDDTPLKPSAYQGEYWANANGCDLTPEVTKEAARDVNIERYSCPDGVDVVRYIIPESGHSWPGGQQGSLIGDQPYTKMNATDVIWDFFMQHSGR